MKSVLITGITGQDGAYLARDLVAKGCRVFGLVRRTSTPSLERLEELEIADQVTLLDGDLSDSSSLSHAVDICAVEYKIDSELFSEVRRLSSLDGLTGLGNRRHFFEVAKVEFERTRRHARPLSVAMIDLDRYKELNDRWGHLVGDAVLREVAERLRDSVRTIDVVARYGGDEFVVLMPETGLAEALLVAGRVCRRVAQGPVVDDGVTVATTVSVGVAEIGAQCETLEDLLKCADQALYAAKEAGRNRVEAHGGSR